MFKYFSFVLRTFLSVSAQYALLQLCHAEAETIESKQTQHNDLYVFDPNLFKGSGLNQDLIERFNQVNQIEAGTYTVDIYVNDIFLERKSIRFEKVEGQDGSVDACLPLALFEHAGILGDVDFRQKVISNDQSLKDIQCLTLSQAVSGSKSIFDFSKLRLNLIVPQSLMKNIPRGYVDPSELDDGSSIGYINYLTNYYHTKNKANDLDSYETAFVSLNGGINFGKWQYRQQSNFSMDSSNETSWNHIRSYVQRPIHQLSSELLVGQQYTSGQFLSGLPYIGLSLKTDERMRPDSMRGYAPVIRGVAQTNAKVSVEQNGREIYQLTVAPGSFEINDLYPTNYDGNLTVIVTEADGTIHSTEVPYSAVPNSMRSGLSNYSIALGRTNLDNTNDVYFSDINYERGVNNNFTLNGGLRLSQDYQAAVFGGVWSSFIGAIGSNITYSRADVAEQFSRDSLDGWMANLTYSKTILPTDTTIAIAGYRYSTDGYRELNDILGLEYAGSQGVVWDSSTYLQQSRFQVNISQQLGKYGSFYLAGTTQNYRGERKRDTSFQAGFNKSFNNFNLSINYTRQKTYSNDGYANKDEGFDSFGGISFHTPLSKSRKPTTPTLNTYYNQSNNEDNYQLSINGALDQDYSLNYNLGINGSKQNNYNNYTVGVYKRFSNIQLGYNTSYSEQYWQNSLNFNGAIAFHSGGVTLGPYLNETFALIEAKGAKGAKVISSPNSKIDRFGYALVPNVSPYKYNRVALDPQGMANNVELVGGEQRIAPYAGAAVKLKFATRTGYNLLIQSQLDNDQVIPMGTDVMSQAGEVIGMVGQAGQVYLQVPDRQGVLKLWWGGKASEVCLMPYVITDQELNQPLIKLNATCQVEH